MKKYLIFLLTIMCWNFINSQNTDKNDSIQSYNIINKEVKLLKEKGIENIMSIFDESGKIIIIWEEKQKQKALKFYYNNSNCRKRKRVKLTQKNKDDFNNCLEGYKYIEEMENVDCNQQVHAFIKIYVNGLINGKTTFSNSFYSHCGTEKQRKNISSLLNLYHNLFLK